MNPTEEHMITAALGGGSEISTEVLATLAEIGEDVNASLDLDEVLARAAALIKRHIDYEIFGVIMIEGDASYLVHRFAIGYPRELAEGLRIPMAQGITGTAAATGHSVRVSDTSKDPRYINAIESVRSELAVPLMVRGKCVGVLDIQSRHLDYFTRDQQNILTLLASRLAIAIENARLFEKVKAQADTLLLLSEVGRETSAILDVEELLRRAAEQTKRVIDYQILSIMLYTEEQTLSILAANLAVSLENAHLYEQLAKEEARLERDLQAAKRIQGALLRPVPTEDYGVDLAARYLSAREVCGDLYDLLRYGPQQLGIALGDVSGKGTAAALYGAVAIGIMRSLAPQKLQPAEMLKQMNQLVGERRIEGRFMTACFATWQKGRQKLRVANAGQSQPLLYKDHRCGKIELTGFPLGIYEDVAYDEWGVTLEPGNILVFHSDGITETANSEGQFFGTTRLRELIEKHHALTAAELADKILGEVDWFSRSAPLSDDRTLVVMKVR